ncbi:MAG TPA: hypothetical protein VIH54_16705 [Chthoniobacterales bacterium]|jgi:hypothetical protein
MFRRSKRLTPRRIEIYLENLEQFFNSMDPSPSRALEPLERNAEWERAELPETYPSAL